MHLPACPNQGAAGGAAHDLMKARSDLLIDAPPPP